MRTASLRIRFTLILALLAIAIPSSGAEQEWVFLPIEDIGARRFAAEHSSYDGRGVIVAVLDTGVDMTIPGLNALPNGDAKVIDARDFTGQGEIELSLAERVDGGLLVAEGLRLEGLDRLGVAPAADHLVWTGVLDESRFQNSAGLQDLDDDGSSAGRFGIVVFAADRVATVEALGEGKGVKMRRGWGEKAAQAEQARARREYSWIVVIDRDRDGHLDDEILHRDYAVDLQSFTLRDEDNDEARSRLGISISVLGDDEPELVLHHDDGGHGSHVAGIAAGYSVHGQKGLDGVAPGAWVISCKLGNNSLSGGATVTGSMKAAYEYVGELSEEYGVPIVINMSFGIGSEIEGDAAMERWLDGWLDEHSDVVVCHSAGNSGPGLSNVGTPAAADGVIASAALITKTMARDLYGGAFTKDELYGFSSRGGEVAKPDVAAPGGASSTIPLWAHRDRYNGTSMASPQTAGAVAALMSGLVQTDRSWNFGMFQRALIASGADLPGYTRIDVGGGVVDMPRAWNALVGYADAGEADLVTMYEVRTEAPGQPDGEAPAAYWRAGGWYPAAPEQQAFNVTPRFAKDVDADARNTFYRAFDLSSDADWIRIDRTETYINGPTTRTINLSYDAAKLSEPGLYVGTVTGRAKGTERSGDSAYEFELVVTIVVPHLIQDEPLFFSGQRIDPGAFRRSFVRVPVGASSLTATLEIPRGDDGSVRMVLHDPEGRRIARAPFSDSEQQRVRTVVVSGEDLMPGVWELDVRGGYAMAVQSSYDLEIRVDGMLAVPSEVTSMSFGAPGTDPSVELEVTPVFDTPFRGRASGALDHWYQQRTIEMSGSTWELPFSIDESLAGAEFTVELTPALYNQMTDFAVNIADASGNYIVQSGLGQSSDTLRLSPAAPGEYTLMIEAGFAMPDGDEDWEFSLTERYEWAHPVSLQGTHHGDAAFRLVPDVPGVIEFSASGSAPVAPDGFVNAGELRLADDQAVRLTVPVRLRD